MRKEPPALLSSIPVLGDRFGTQGQTDIFKVVYRIMARVRSVAPRGADGMVGTQGLVAGGVLVTWMVTALRPGVFAIPCPAVVVLGMCPARCSC